MARPRKVQTPGVVADPAPIEAPVDLPEEPVAVARAREDGPPRWVLTEQGWELA